MSDADTTIATTHLCEDESAVLRTNKFTRIYESNGWKGKESRSGPSSSLARTQNLRVELRHLLEQKKIISILDAPCGDFHWMSEVMPCDGVKYVGVDIVASAIAANREKFSGPFVDFQVCDLVSGPLPKGQLVFSRDFLFHLSYSDIASFFNNVLVANPEYLMTTSHINNTGFSNSDIVTGCFRWFDLLAPPFQFPTNFKAAVTDGGGDRYMYLWKLQDIAPYIETFVQEFGTKKQIPSEHQLRSHCLVSTVS